MRWISIFFTKVRVKRMHGCARSLECEPQKTVAVAEGHKKWISFFLVFYYACGYEVAHTKLRGVNSFARELQYYNNVPGLRNFSSVKFHLHRCSIVVSVRTECIVIFFFKKMLTFFFVGTELTTINIGASLETGNFRSTFPRWINCDLNSAGAGQAWWGSESGFLWMLLNKNFFTWEKRGIGSLTKFTPYYHENSR